MIVQIVVNLFKRLAKLGKFTLKNTIPKNCAEEMTKFLGKEKNQLVHTSQIYWMLHVVRGSHFCQCEILHSLENYENLFLKFSDLF
jgi:hypothetical protein